MSPIDAEHLVPGDVVVLRDGEVIEVLNPHGAPPNVVRWEDGRESTL